MIKKKHIHTHKSHPIAPLCPPPTRPFAHRPPALPAAPDPSAMDVPAARPLKVLSQPQRIADFACYFPFIGACLLFGSFSFVCVGSCICLGLFAVCLSVCFWMDFICRIFLFLYLWFE